MKNKQSTTVLQGPLKGKRGALFGDSWVIRQIKISPKMRIHTVGRISMAKQTHHALWKMTARDENVVGEVQPLHHGE